MLILIGCVDEHTNVEGAIRIPRLGWEEAAAWAEDHKVRALEERCTITLVTDKSVRAAATPGLPSMAFVRVADYAFDLVKARDSFSLAIERPEDLPVTLDPLPLTFDIWIEGYRATGEAACAKRLFANVEAPNFKEACRKALQLDASFNEEEMTYWGCRLFDNEADARKAFG